MERLKEFFLELKKAETFTLATCYDNRVTMREVSPVVIDGLILFYTNSNSLKYKQLVKNKNCCVKIGYFSAEATAKFLGSTMLEENKDYREAYENKFPNAFDEKTPHNGCDDDFIILKIHNLKGWIYDGNVNENTEYFEMEVL